LLLPQKRGFVTAASAAECASCPGLCEDELRDHGLQQPA
jgi:hypothetical protein